MHATDNSNDDECCKIYAKSCCVVICTGLVCGIVAVILYYADVDKQRSHRSTDCLITTSQLNQSTCKVPSEPATLYTCYGHSLGVCYNTSAEDACCLDTQCSDPYTTLYDTGNTNSSLAAVAHAMNERVVNDTYPCFYERDMCMAFTFSHTSTNYVDVLIWIAVGLVCIPILIGGALFCGDITNTPNRQLPPTQLSVINSQMPRYQPTPRNIPLRAVRIRPPRHHQYHANNDA